jgi:hypothetical protein
VKILQNSPRQQLVDDMGLPDVQQENIVQFVGYCTETETTIIEQRGRKIVAEQDNRALCFEYLQNGSLDRYISGTAVQHFSFLLF